MKNKTFSVSRFNREVEKQVKFYNLSKSDAKKLRASTLYKCLVYANANSKKGN